MEDLIATISGGMHVSQDGYDIKALHVSVCSFFFALIPLWSSQDISIDTY